MAVINWATLVRCNVIDNGVNAVAGQDRTGTRLVAGLLPPALLPHGHRSMPSSEPAPSESYSPARSAFAAQGLRTGRSGRFASPLDSQSLAAVASQAARKQRPADFPVDPASDACWREEGWCDRTDATALTTQKLADRLRPRSAHRKPTLSLRGWR